MHTRAVVPILVVSLLYTSSHAQVQPTFDPGRFSGLSGLLTGIDPDDVQETFVHNVEQHGNPQDTHKLAEQFAASGLASEVTATAARHTGVSDPIKKQQTQQSRIRPQQQVEDRDEDPDEIDRKIEAYRPEDAMEGIVELHDATFDKVVIGNAHTLVEFYIPEDVSCQVNVAVNPELAQRFSINNKYPTFLYFPYGSLQAHEYGEEHTFDGFFGFLAMQKYLTEGQLPVFERLVQLFMVEKDAETRKTLVAAADAVALGLIGADSRDGKFYVKTMHKILELGHKYIKQEMERSYKLIDSTSLSKEKETEYNHHVNILKVFRREREASFATS
eukprot:jgi/Chlat1/5109/Chrsp33S00390